MLENLLKVDWSELSQPEWNQPGAIPDALRELAAAADEDAARNSYNRVLFALGNNHAGTYYPAAVVAVPFLGEILEHGADWPRETVLDILIDYSSSFGPELGETNGSDGSAEQVEAAMRESIAKLRSVVEVIATSPDAPQRLRTLARELLEL
jgi:hypothetical protein